jgi:hypothetical protein
VSIPAQPETYFTLSSSQTQPYVKVATKDIVLGDDATPVEIMSDLLFEDIGGQEIINILRNDLVNGQNVIYTPIKNINKIYAQSNPKNIVAIQNTSESIFKNYPIDLMSKIPNVGNGTNGETVYIEQDSENLVIEFVNMEQDEYVDIQILSSGQLLDDTIY